MAPRAVPLRRAFVPVIALAMLLAGLAAMPVAARSKDELDSPVVMPRTGTTATTFLFGVRYTGKHQPDQVLVHIGGSTFRMVLISGGCGSKCEDDDQSVYGYSGRLPVGKHSVRFESRGDDAADSIAAGSITVTGSSSTPRPTAKPTPTPKPTHAPKPSKAPKPPKTPTPTAGPTARPKPSASTVPSPTASVPPADTPRPSRGAAAVTTRPVPSEPPLTVAGTGTLGGDQQINLDDTALASGFSAYAWLVPGFALGLPGLLLLIVVGLQILGATFFVPLTRRLLGGSRPGTGSRRRTTSR